MVAVLSCSCNLFGEDEDTSAAGGGTVITDDSDDEEDDEGIYFAEEEDYGEVEKGSSEPEDFVGTWVSTSDRAEHYYGNIELKIAKNGSWKGDITGEKLKGTWKYDKGVVHMDDTVLDFDFDLTFNKDGTLIMSEAVDEGFLNTVLTKQ